METIKHPCKKRYRKLSFVAKNLTLALIYHMSPVLSINQICLISTLQIPVFDHV